MRACVRLKKRFFSFEYCDPLDIECVTEVDENCSVMVAMVAMTGRNQKTKELFFFFRGGNPLEVVTPLLDYKHEGLNVVEVR